MNEIQRWMRPTMRARKEASVETMRMEFSMNDMSERAVGAEAGALENIWIVAQRAGRGGSMRRCACGAESASMRRDSSVDL